MEKKKKKAEFKFERELDRLNEVYVSSIDMVRGLKLGPMAAMELAERALRLIQKLQEIQEAKGKGKPFIDLKFEWAPYKPDDSADEEKEGN